MHIYFFVAGIAVKPWLLDTDRIKDQDKAVLRRIQATLEEKAGALKCGTHGEQITAVVSGPTYQQLGLELKGCCDQFVQIVSKRVKPADIH